MFDCADIALLCSELGYISLCHVITIPPLSRQYSGKIKDFSKLNSKGLNPVYPSKGKMYSPTNLDGSRQLSIIFLI